MAKKWNKSVQFPCNNYLLRCIEEEIGSTKKGTPTVKLTFEVVSPENGEIAGEQYEVVGAKIWHNIYFKSVDDSGNLNEEKTAKMTAMVGEFYEKLGLTYNGNPDNPNLGFKGKFVWATLDNREEAKRKNPTAEQLKLGRPGDVLTHPVTGEPMVNNYPTVTEWICIGEKPAGMAF